MFFSCDLNDDNVSAHLIAFGSSFHKAGPATKNAPLPCVRTKSLKIIRLCTGNQCNSFRTGVFESNFRVRVITLAAACWTICNLRITDDGRPYSRELTLSNLDVTNAWTSCLAALSVIYLRMSLIHLICWKQEHHTFLTWLFKFMCSSFNWSLLSSIHDLISEIHAWMVSIATCSPVLEDVSKAI